MKKINELFDVKEDFNKVAFGYGPLVLCAEGTDNPFDLFATTIAKNAKIKGEILYGDAYILNAKVNAFTYPKTDALYIEKLPKKQKVEVKLIPYFTWANRDKNDMTVWFNKE